MSARLQRLLDAALLAIGGAAALAAAAIVVAPPAPFGERLDFLVYQSAGYAPGTIFRFVAGLAAACLGAFALRHSATASGWRAAATFLGDRDRVYTILFASILAVAGASLLSAPWALCANPDSLSYLQFDPQRTIGYPALVWAVRTATGAYDALYPIQICLLLGATAVLAHRFGRLVQDRLAALAALALMAGNASLMGFGGMLLAESLFAAMLCLHLACILALIERFSWTAAILAGVFLALAVLARPIGYALFGALPALLLVLPRPRVRGFLAVAVAAAVPLLAASAANQVRHGFFATQNIGGFSLLGHVAHLIEPDMPSEFADLPARIAARAEPIRTRIAAETSLHAHWRATMNAYNDLLYGAALPEIDAWLAEHPPADPQAIGSEKIAIAGRLARETIRHDPAGYAWHVASHYYGLWLVSLMPQGPVGLRIAQCLRSAPDVDADPPFDSAAARDAFASERRLTPVDIFWSFATLVQFPALAVAILAAWIAIPLWFASAARSAPWRAAIYAALGANAYYLMFASIQVAQPRYAAVVEPWLVVLVLLVPFALSRR